MSLREVHSSILYFLSRTSFFFYDLWMLVTPLKFLIVGCWRWWCFPLIVPQTGTVTWYDQPFAPPFSLTLCVPGGSRSQPGGRKVFLRKGCPRGACEEGVVGSHRTLSGPILSVPSCSGDVGPCPSLGPGEGSQSHIHPIHPSVWG